MAVIGAININLGVITTGFGKGLKTAGSQLGGFVKSVTSLKGAVLGFGAAIAGSAAVSGLTSLVKNSLDLVDAMGDSAQRIGTTTEALSKLRYATQLTGSEAENLDGALQKMNANLGDAAAKGGPAQDALKRIGLDAKDLVNRDPTEAFKKIADGFQTLPTAADRAAVSMDIFGKSGMTLLNTLGANSAELDRLGDEAIKLGIAFRDIDAAKAGAANDALDKMSGVLQGVVNQLTIKLTPTIIAAGDQFVNFAKNGVDSSKLLDSALDNVVSVLGFVANFLAALKGSFRLVTGVAGMGLAVVVAAVDLLGKALEGVINLIPGMNVKFTGVLDEMVKGISQFSQHQLNTLEKELGMPPPSEGVRRYFNALKFGADQAAESLANATNKVNGLGGAQAELLKKISDLSTKLNLQIRTFGKSSEEVEIFKLEQGGATAAMLKGVKAQQEQLAALERQKKQYQEYAEGAMKTFDESRTPLERYETKIQELQKYLKGGAIDEDTFNRAAVQAGKDLFGETPQKREVGALQMGSKEARSALLSYNSQNKSEGLIDVAKNTKEQLGQQQLMVKLLQTIATKGEKQEVVKIN